MKQCITLFLVLFLISPPTLAETKKKLPASWASEEKEIQFGHYVDVHMQENFIVLQENEATKKLLSAINEIGQEMAGVSDRPNIKYIFKVVNDNDVNAFAGPGGYVYITSGLLDILETKEEIAAVFGHEIGHICERHQIRALQNAQNASIGYALLTIGIVVGAAAAGAGSDVQVNPRDLANAASAAAYITTVAVYTGYSRAYEKKADLLSVKYLKKAGYNPEAMASVLEKLEEEKKRRDKDAPFTLFATHPPSKKRIKYIRKEINKLRKEE